jgi:preprotein translocase subunit Sec61beta
MTEIAVQHEPHEQASRKRAGFVQTARAVLWSFFGVRRKSEYEKDAAELNPVYVIAMGIAAAALFVIALLVVVNLVVR